jgi:hypothetical protein
LFLLFISCDENPFETYTLMCAKSNTFFFGMLKLNGKRGKMEMG